MTRAFAYAALVWVSLAACSGGRKYKELDGGAAADGAATGACDSLNDPDNCGTCGFACSTLPNVRAGAPVECRAGRCFIPPESCDQGYGHCSERAEDGCETNLTAPENCGACGKACPAVAPFCSSEGTSQECVATCPASAPDQCGLGCVNLKTDVNNCAICGNKCTFANAEGACVEGACALSKCVEGFGDCKPEEPGCETALLSSTTNCGSCGNSCERANATSSCTQGQCTTPVCDVGFGNCNKDKPDCETRLNSNDNCGECGKSCSGATPLCSSSNGTATCVSDCPAAAPEKCGTQCVNITNDPANCGKCGESCNFPNAAGLCVSGKCMMGACNDGYGDCTNAPGCETRLDSNSNCGRCGTSCTFANATSSCNGGACSTPVCAANFGNCDKTSPDCETPLNTTANCGICNNACSGSTPLCSSAGGQPQCVSDCAVSTPDKCGAKCVNLSTDPSYCGSCTNACSVPANGTALCDARMCKIGCNGGYTPCGTECVNTKTSAAHCGGCNSPCSGTCTNGLCCTGGTINCGNSCVNTSNNNAHCGGCNSPCLASQSCSGGSCKQKDGESCATNSDCLVGGCSVYYRDEDGDGRGSPTNVKKICNTPSASTLR